MQANLIGNTNNGINILQFQSADKLISIFDEGNNVRRIDAKLSICTI